MSSEIEFSVIMDDVRTFEADLLVLKHAAGFFGADETVIAALLPYCKLSTDEIANHIKENGYFHTTTNGSIQTPKVIFIKTPPLPQLQYQQVRDFAYNALTTIARELPNVQHVAMTVHGPLWGLDTSVAFLAQITGLLTAITEGNIPNELNAISIVEIDAQRLGLLSKILRYRFEGEYYSKRSSSGSFQKIDKTRLQQLQDKYHAKTSNNNV